MEPVPLMGLRPIASLVAPKSGTRRTTCMEPELSPCAVLFGVVRQHGAGGTLLLEGTKVGGLGSAGIWGVGLGTALETLLSG